MRLTAPALRWSLAALAAMSLPSCKTADLPCVASSGLNQLTITTTGPGANSGLATEIDLVFATGMKAYQAIEQMKARDYFAQREQLVRDFPGGFQIRSFGLDPAQRNVRYGTEPPCNPAGTLMFVNYNNDKPNRLRLGKAKAGTLVLGPEDFSWRPE